jgi:hypothetical protein
MIKSIIILMATLTLFSQGAMATTVQEASPTKVLVITRDDGTVLIIQPRDLDYKYALDAENLSITRTEVDTDNRSVFRKIFGKKCNRRK